MKNTEYMRANTMKINTDRSLNKKQKFLAVPNLYQCLTFVVRDS